MTLPTYRWILMVCVFSLTHFALVGINFVDLSLYISGVMVKYAPDVHSML